MGEGVTNGVSKEVCEQCRQNIFSQLDDLTDNDKSFAAALTELKVISAQQLVLQQQNAKMLEKLEARQEKFETRQDALEVLVSNKLGGGDKADKIWKQPWFKVVVVTGCIILVVLVGAAVGVNIIEAWKGAIK